MDLWKWDNIEEDRKEFYKMHIQEIIEQYDLKNIKEIFVSIKGALDSDIFSSIELNEEFFIIKSDVDMKKSHFERITK